MQIRRCFSVLVLVIGLICFQYEVSLAAVVNGCLNGDPNFPFWRGGSHAGEFVDLSSAYQEGNCVYVNIVRAGYHSGEVTGTQAVKLVIANTHRIWASQNIMFDPDSDYNSGDSSHEYRRLFEIIDEEIEIQR